MVNNLESLKRSWLLKLEQKRKGLGWLVPAALIAVQVWSTIRFLSGKWQAIQFPYPLDYGEGPILDQVLRLANFQNIYRVDLDTPPFVIANYPPVFLLLQVPLVRFFGPALWYGRAISALSILLTALLISLTLHTITRDRLASISAGLLLFAIPYVVFWSSLNRVDSLALALSWAALFIIVRWSGWRSSILAAMLLVAAVYTRQTYGMAASLAACGWLWKQRSRSNILFLAGTTMILGLILLLIMNVSSAGGFFFSIVTSNVNEYSYARAFSALSSLVHRLPLLLICSGLFFFIGIKARLHSWWVVGPYLIGSTLTALTVGKIGSNMNYLYELSAALCLAMGALLAWQRDRPWLRCLLSTLLILQIGWSLNTFGLSRIEQRAEIDRLMQMVHDTDGLILADEYMALLPLDQRPLYLEPIGFKHLVRAGVWDQQGLINSIRTHRFALILIYPQYAEERWTDEMLRQIRESYTKTGELAGTSIYEPQR